VAGQGWRWCPCRTERFGYACALLGASLRACSMCATTVGRARLRPINLAPTRRAGERRSGLGRMASQGWAERSWFGTCAAGRTLMGAGKAIEGRLGSWGVVVWAVMGVCSLAAFGSRQLLQLATRCCGAAGLRRPGRRSGRAASECSAPPSDRSEQMIDGRPQFSRRHRRNPPQRRLARKGQQPPALCLHPYHDADHICHCSPYNSSSTTYVILWVEFIVK
jgi:hypothetical protein